MKTFYHTGALGDIIYSLPTIKSLDGGTIVLNLPEAQYESIKPLLLSQSYIHKVKNIAESGLPNDVIDLSKWRLNPDINKKHIVNLVLNTFQFPDYDFSKRGWIEGFENYSESNFSIINRTSRYNDKIYNWNKEVKWLLRHSKQVYFMGLWVEYLDFMNNETDIHLSRISYWPTNNLLEATQNIAKARYFSGNQSSLLSIRQGLGLPYRMEQSPNHVDCNQYSLNETIINPYTRKLHFLYTSIKKLI